MEEKRFLFGCIFIFLISSSNFSEPRFTAAQEDDCQPTSCDPSGPIIRFPFRLRGRQPERCGYPGFDLFCNSTNGTEFDFQFPVRGSTRSILLPVSARASVQGIDYVAQVLRLSVLNGSCLPGRVPTANASAPPFELFDPYPYSMSGYTLFNCSGSPLDVRYSRPITCLSSGLYRTYAYRSYNSFSAVSISNCVKLYNISDISEVLFNGPSEYSVDDTQLHWTEPSCGDCERRGMNCMLRNNGTNSQIECLGRPIITPTERETKGVPKNVVISVVVVGVFLIAILVGVLYYVYSVKNRKRRIQQFLEDYKAFRPTRYSFAEIKMITEGFNHRLGQGGYGTVFKGKLSDEIPVAVKILNNVKGNGEEFINEVGTIGKIHHVYVVRLVGYCADGYRRALVYEFLQNDSLEKYISSGKQGRTLGWEKMHDIAIGIVKGLDYLHQGCNQRILHFDIKPHNILLDQNLNPKVADFGLAKLCSKEKSVVTMTAARGTIGYIAPEVFSRNFGNVSYKSDIYSFGMLLLDMVGGRKNFNSRNEEGSEFYFPEWMYNQLDKGEDIAIQIEKAEDSEIVRRLIIVGLWCIQWYPADRPSTKIVIQMLEGEKMPVMPPNPFSASNSGNGVANSMGSIFSSETWSSS